jgi:hypothetical protein
MPANVMRHWKIHLTNRERRVGENSGVAVITIKGGRVVHAEHFILDLGQNFKLNWSAVFYSISTN